MTTQPSLRGKSVVVWFYLIQYNNHTFIQMVLTRNFHVSICFLHVNVGLSAYYLLLRLN